MALALRLFSVGALTLATAAPAFADPPKVLVLPYQQLSKKMPEDLGEATTVVVTKEMSHGGIAVIRAEDVTDGPATKSAKGSAASNAPTGDPQAGGKAERLIVQAKSAMEDSDFDGSAKTLKKAIKLLEDNADAVPDLRLLSEAYLQLGVTYFRDGQEDEGDEMLTRAIHLDPERKLSESDYPPIFIKVFERGRFNVLRRPRAQIEVKAKAGAQVLLDGRNMGKAPIELKEALPGEHWIRVERPGDPPQVKKIQARGKTTLVVEFEGGESAKEESAPVGVLGAIARNEIGKEHVKQLAGAGRRAGADFVMFGAIFATDTAYQIRTAYVRVKDGKVGRLLDVAFDLDMLSAEIEVFKLAEDAKKQTEGELTRAVTEPTFALAPDFKSGGASSKRVLAGTSETRMSSAVAAPAPIKPPESLYAAAPPEPLATADAKSPTPAAPPPKAQVLPKDEIAAAPRSDSGGPVTAANLVIDDEKGDDKGGSKWWIWALVGVAAAGAVAASGYAIYASQGSNEGSLQVRW